MKLTKAQSIAIKTIMLKNNITQQDVARLWGVTRQNINGLISGKFYISNDNLKKLLKDIKSTKKELNIMVNKLDK